MVICLLLVTPSELRLLKVLDPFLDELHLEGVHLLDPLRFMGVVVQAILIIVMYAISSLSAKARTRKVGRLTEYDPPGTVEGRFTLGCRISLRGLSYQLILFDRTAWTNHRSPGISIAVHKRQSVRLDRIVPPPVHFLYIRPFRHGEVLSGRVGLLADL
jgi:hypothetical protein